MFGVVRVLRVLSGLLGLMGRVLRALGAYSFKALWLFRYHVFGFRVRDHAAQRGGSASEVI